MPEFHSSLRIWITAQDHKQVLSGLWTYKETQGTVLSKLGLIDGLVLKNTLDL